MRVVDELEPLVIENNLACNLPRIDPFDGIGQPIENIVHHPTYEQAGNIIYSTHFLRRLSKPGGLLEALSFMFISGQAGEAGHNCPAACSTGIIRVFQKCSDFPKKSFYLNKLLEPSYTDNFTGAQFLTEIQGGSDVGQNAVKAYQIDFHDAYATAIGNPADGFKLVMENVLHISRLFNTFCVLGMARLFYSLSLCETAHRVWASYYHVFVGEGEFSAHQSRK